MRFVLIAILMVVGLLCGCKSKEARAKQKPPYTRVTPVQKGPIETVLIGKVRSVNERAGYVILSFPIGRMPLIDQKLFIYRDGVKVGVVRVTGPQMDTNIAADIVEGNAKVDDEVRPE